MNVYGCIIRVRLVRPLGVVGSISIHSPAMLSRTSRTRGTAVVRTLLGTVALLAVIAPPASALVHGAAHHHDALLHPASNGGVQSSGEAAHTEASAPQRVASADGTVKRDAAGSHPILHVKVVARSVVGLSPALPAEMRLPSVDVKVLRKSVAIGAAPDYPVAPHSLVPDQPRAPPLG